MKRVLFLLSCLVISSLTQANSPALEFYRQQKIYHKEFTQLPTSIEQHSYQQLIDPDDPAAGTFAQRYYIDTTYSDNNHSPVFFYICGEATCRPGALNGAIRTYAKEFHAKLVALEHRYYGKSIPTEDLSTKNLRYLSTTNALKDLARFQHYMINTHHWQGKWVSFGGSYPGSLSAFYRLKYNNLVVGAVASSAPVKAKEDYFEYDRYVTKVVDSACAQAMRQAVSQVEEALAKPELLKQYKQWFMASDVDDNTDFLYVLADVGADAVQYGGHQHFCQALTQTNEPLKAYAEQARRLFESSGITAKDLTPVGAMSIDANDYYSSFGMRQWFYQSCTEYGYWQIAHPDRAQSTRSQLINLAYHHALCKRLFNIDIPAAIDNMNALFYQQLFAPSVSNIFFTNGSNDPWSALSITIENGNATNPNSDYQTIAGTAHCADLHHPKESDPDSLKQVRNKTRELLNHWLS